MSTFAANNLMNRPGDTGSDGSPGPATGKYLVGAAGLIPVALGGLGLSNGGIATLAINEPGFVGAGGVCLLLALLVGALSTAGAVAAGRPRRWLGFAGLGFLFVGILAAGYAALVVPTLTNSPNIQVRVATSGPPGGDLGVAAEVRATAIANKTLYFVEIDGLAYVPGKKRYRPVGSPLYLGQFGADSSGKVDAKIDMPVPMGSYSAISVQAWYGKHSGPCQSLGAMDSASAGTSQNPIVQDQTGRDGCILVRVPKT